MKIFTPPELKDQISEAISTLTKITRQNINDFGDEISEIISDDLTSDKDDEYITNETELYVWLPQSEFCERSIVRNCGDFIQLVNELKTAQLIDDKYCQTEKRVLVQVNFSNLKSEKTINNSLPDTYLNSTEELQKKWVELHIKRKIINEKIVEMNKKYDELDKDRIVGGKDLIHQLHLLTKEINTLKPEGNPFERYFPIVEKLNDQEIICSLTQGVTIFGLLNLKEDLYSEYQPPATEEDIFVEVQTKQLIPIDQIDNIVLAYLFELSNNVGIELEIEAKTNYYSDDFFSDIDFLKAPYRLRPLLIGKGLEEPLKLYNQAITSFDEEIKILFFNKIVEFVSQSVVRQSSIESIRSKLLSHNALSPDAQYISELTNLIDEQKVYTKDREAIKLTIKTCCDATELAKIAPNYIVELFNINKNSTRKERESALEKLGLCLSDTRNSIAHAKANFTPTGNECPSEEYTKFVECLKITVQQIIRWYASQSEIMRVV